MKLSMHQRRSDGIDENQRVITIGKKIKPTIKRQHDRPANSQHDNGVAHASVEVTRSPATPPPKTMP
jgi:hypothetical protein